ncbi:hypothetical protein CRG98_019653 [Punica granatum]|uniref:Uncharacterized protein n=1 Tax=Punica granatum TaxID=22663 RepID=A0A2I0JUG7_PUNGR|nr:hypothetical protein CRG98_019653 [Punica granatum]
MHVRKHEKTRESSLDRAKKVDLNPRKASQASVTSSCGKPESSFAYFGSGSLEIRGKSRGSVRESGDSVERLEECSGARACTFGELSARGLRLECMGGVRRGARVGMRVCAAMGVLFTRELVLYPKSPK